MTTRTDRPAAAGRRTGSRLGLPELAGHGRLVGANLIDSLGTGLVLAFTVVYFARTTSVPLAQIGTALSLGRLLSLPVPALVGPLLDRYGPRRVAVAANLVCAVGFLGFPAARSLWSIVLTQLVVQAGTTAYWTSSRSLVALAASAPQERPRWFALVSALRNTGMGLGALVSSATVDVAGATGLRAVVVANALTFVAAAVLIAAWSPGSTLTGPMDKGIDVESSGFGYKAVLRDRVYLRLVAANLAYVLGAMMPSVLLAVYVTASVRSPAWLVGVLLALNTAVVATAQTSTYRLLERHRLSRIAAAGLAADAVAFVLFALVPSGGGVLAGACLVSATLVFTAAEVVGSPSLNELSVRLSAPHLHGRYQAVYQMSWAVGGALAPALLTGLLALGPLWPWIALALGSAGAAAVALTLDGRQVDAAT
ncbi:MFS transporter [Streptomyces sp. PTM05]|uniref:MFS transporter n=1 Tax=Streptantibioticus parmotrematis TaxID=2873249 RepID=A0ABS7QS46_9ACTN|nr:MFS transporter [Streptantibioticus parmotrematis]MBY8886016.1 MFS transporter [Streptantibioticus parmotrematis]